MLASRRVVNQGVDRTACGAQRARADQIPLAVHLDERRVASSNKDNTALPDPDDRRRRRDPRGSVREVVLDDLLHTLDGRLVGGRGADLAAVQTGQRSSDRGLPVER